MLGHAKDLPCDEGVVGGEHPFVPWMDKCHPGSDRRGDWGGTVQRGGPGGGAALTYGPAKKKGTYAVPYRHVEVVVLVVDPK